MLDVMRSNARSSLIVLIFGAIIISFVFSFGRGSSGFRTRTPETWAARVNGELVTANEFNQAYSNRLRQMAAMRGGKYTADNAKQDNLRKDTLSSLVDQALIAQQADDLGIVVADEEVADAIARSPQFQQDGKFDFEYYKRLVENGYGMSVPRFEEGYRRDLLRTRVLQAALSGANVSEDEVKAAWTSQHESAAISYVKLNPFMFREKVAVTDAEAEAYAKEHAAEVEQKYNAEKDARWTQPPSSKVRAVTVPVPPNANAEQEKAARQRIDAALAEVKAGKDFAEVAKAKSEDQASKAQGGDLGWISMGGSPYGKTLEEQALKVAPGQVSDVFKDRSGFHVLKVEERRDRRVQPLDEVRKQIATDLLKTQRAKDLARERAQQALQAVKSGKDLKDLYPVKKTDPGQFDFSSFTTPQTVETESFHPMGGFVPGIGQAPKLSSSVFALARAGDVPPAPIEEGDTWYVFKLKSREHADPSKVAEDEKKSLHERLVAQKQNELYKAWIGKLRKDSRVVENAAILSYEAGPAHEAFSPDDF